MNTTAINDKKNTDTFDLHLRSRYEQLYQLVLKCPFNITSIRESADFAIKNILDSLYFFIRNPLSLSSVVDIGSGGGFPGLALAIYNPNWQVTLVDSIGKKCRYLESMTKKLSLDNVNIINSRAEMIHDLSFDLVTARGVGTVKEVIQYSAQLLKPNGAWLMYKGTKLDEELKNASDIISKRGLKSEIYRVDSIFTRSYLYLSR